MNIVKINEISEEIKPAKLLIATKVFNTNELKEIYKNGFNIFGENRVDSFLLKYDELKDLDIKWHFIGHLQRNKCKEIINKIECLHSLDSIDLAKIIDEKRDKPLDCFIELLLVKSETKSGIKEDEINDFLNKLKEFKKINVLGFMVMANKNDPIELVEEIFKKANELTIKYGFKELSMGMSSDYNIAINNGSTIVRLGSILV